MKNLKFLPFAALIFAVGSAFTTTSKSVGDEYVKVQGTYLLRSEQDGHCATASGTCSYTKISDAGGAGQDQLDANFQSRTPGQWIAD